MDEIKKICTEEMIAKCFSREVWNVIRCIIKKPELLLEYHLDKEDFTDELGRMIFTAIQGMYQEGYRVITEASLINAYDYWLSVEEGELKSDYDKSIIVNQVLCSEDMPLENFPAYYNDVKKYSLLRRAMRLGVCVSEFFTDEKPQSSDDKNMSDTERRNAYQEAVQKNILAENQRLYRVRTTPYDEMKKILGFRYEDDGVGEYPAQK